MSNEKQKILFLSWKDITHPSAGGAELLTDTLAEHLAHTCDVTYFTSAYPGARPQETMHGYTVIRRGGIYTTYLHAFFWWHTQQHTKKWDHIIDQVHGFPFFSVLYFQHPRVITLVMEVAGDLWDNTPLWVRLFGKTLERIWLHLYKKHPIVTISNSTKDDLMRSGIPAHHISVIPMFSHIQNDSIPKKPPAPMLLVIGRIAPVKQIEHCIEAYRIAQKTIPSLTLGIIGKTEPAYEAYKRDIMNSIGNDPHITFLEHADENQKQMYLEHAHLLLMTSQKEGYGLVILEAAACGTPTIGYRVPGIQDAILDTKTGVLVEDQQPAAMAESICEILLDASRYTDMQKRAYKHATAHTKEQTSLEFTKILYGTTARA